MVESSTQEQAPDPGLGWDGVFTSSEIVKLKEEFGDMIICPGYASRFGKPAQDGSGKVVIPGASSHIWETRRTLRGWQSKSIENDKYSWWPAELTKRGWQSIKVSCCPGRCRLV